jgi:hypothetical protein
MKRIFGKYDTSGRHFYVVFLAIYLKIQTAGCIFFTTSGRIFLWISIRVRVRIPRSILVQDSTKIATDKIVTFK